jgi:hypothetical protein
MIKPIIFGAVRYNLRSMFYFNMDTERVLNIILLFYNLMICTSWNFRIQKSTPKNQEQKKDKNCLKTTCFAKF